MCPIKWNAPDRRASDPLNPNNAVGAMTWRDALSSFNWFSVIQLKRQWT